MCVRFLSMHPGLETVQRALRLSGYSASQAFGLFYMQTDLS
jgi:hypothetical protein